MSGRREGRRDGGVVVVDSDEKTSDDGQSDGDNDKRKVGIRVESDGKARQTGDKIVTRSESWKGNKDPERRQNED